MGYFMAGFFGAFSFFKLINLREFVSTYARYDVLARSWPSWGLAYPFAEAALGIAYLGNWAPTMVNGLTLLLMSFSSIGVIRAVVNKSKIQCACLGTASQATDEHRHRCRRPRYGGHGCSRAAYRRPIALCQSCLEGEATACVAQ